ncbi:ASCH domain-containing protein [Streptomyces venezuelae]|uniref:ASCH domain-containing protein n=1 Tax=Streptomyces venezuelae TaxID=54571 RepID=UPI00332E5428
MNPQTLYFHPDYLDAVRAGRKTTTVRLRDRVETGPVSLVFELAEELALPGVVKRVTAKTVAELSDADARADGFDDLAALQGALRYHYPGIGPADDVTVVHFTLLP